MKFPPFPSGQVKEFGLQLMRFRLFTLIPRRFTSHYWDNRHCLNFTVWWQWGTRCFFIRNRVILRPTFSNWIQIIDRIDMGDLDAKVILQCILTLSSNSKYQGQNAPNIYNEMVKFATKDKGVKG